jgi:hypothetical protein
MKKKKKEKANVTFPYWFALKYFFPNEQWVYNIWVGDMGLLNCILKIKFPYFLSICVSWTCFTIHLFSFQMSDFGSMVQIYDAIEDCMYDSLIFLVNIFVHAYCACV